MIAAGHAMSATELLSIVLRWCAFKDVEYCAHFVHDKGEALPLPSSRPHGATVGGPGPPPPCGTDGAAAIGSERTPPTGHPCPMPTELMQCCTAHFGSSTTTDSRAAPWNMRGKWRVCAHRMTTAVLSTVTVDILLTSR